MKNMDISAGRRHCAIAGIPDTANAGSRIILRIQVQSDPPLDLAGQRLDIVDSCGAVLGQATLDTMAGSDEQAATCDIAIIVPAMVGTHTLTAHLAEWITGGVVFPEVEHTFNVEAAAHQVVPVVWGIPRAVAKGQPFSAIVGARCGAGCGSSGWQVQVRDHAGRVAAEAETGPCPWPGTEGLYYAELDLFAPDDIAQHQWEAHVQPIGTDLPHDSAERAFAVRTTAPADAILRVEAVDRASGHPVEKLKVVAHPFDALTGPDGVAEIAVPSGPYRIFVSGKAYIPFNTSCDLQGETTLQVAMDPDVGMTDADYWA